MSETKSESISSLVDNYSPSSDDNLNAHLVDNLLKDEELSSTWQNYHLIGDVLRDEAPQTLQLDLSETISAAIAQEATILSPNSATQPSTASETLVSSIEDSTEKLNRINVSNIVDATNRFKAKFSKAVKPLGQVAIAASAAGLMIVGVQHNVADNSITPTPVVQTVPLSGYANPVSFSVQPSQLESNQKTQKITNEQIAAEKVAQQRRLQSLLKDHNQQVKLNNK